ncbi:L-asparaginase [Salmonella enterica subsp. salamae serovar 55:k:z39 str. 1315K]|uniref:L-asparaginase n=1 Tax=Salmonella enterica subsp. salamae serovar 55:k:z39 str. 1315K TaxID=1243602 RepID=A0A6C7CP28_SALER|nr:L-asparaginase [Salmonella enterica subsp. salamae serovar 55:k:z39 str. 1315K]
MLLAILNLGSAHRSHVLRVRSFGCALSVSKLAAPITPGQNVRRMALCAIRRTY